MMKNLIARSLLAFQTGNVARHLISEFHMMKPPLSLLIIFIFASPLSAADYHLTFDDEFNDFNSSRWQTSDFYGMRHNGGDFQAQWFADPTYVPTGSTQKPYNPFSSMNGILTIQARPTPENTFSGAIGSSKAQPYVSGQLTSAHKFTQRYGYFELRAKLPAGQGLWSRFWLLTDDGNWPGEYDIFEVLGKDNPTIVRQTTHYYKDAKKRHAIDGSSYRGIVPTDGKFHTYGFLWEPKSVTWYVDGVKTLRQINRINIPMYILLDLAVGNDPLNTFPGSPDGTTPWPSNMELDYIRVYSNDPALPSVTPDDGYEPSVLPNGHKIAKTPSAASLPDEWSAGDIGSPKVRGSSSWNSITGEWVVKGTGYGISGYGDQCHFAGTSLSGDGNIMATVQSVSAINSNEVKSGVMIRESRNQRAREISLLYTVARTSPTTTTSLTFQSRSTANGETAIVATVPSVNLPVSLRLSRKGNTFTGEYSTDNGDSWAPVGTAEITTMQNEAQAGLVVGGNQNNYLRLARANFLDVTIGE
jgi:beta-glucanase (GH16 family)